MLTVKFIFETICILFKNYTPIETFEAFETFYTFRSFKCSLAFS